MSDETAKSVIPPEHDAAIGRAIRFWGHLEHVIDQTIWDLAAIEQQFGACITSQIGSIHPKTRALISLVRLRGGSSELCAALDKFQTSLHAPAEQRARLAHDPRFLNERTGDVVRWQTTATGKEIKFGPEPETIASIDEISERFRRRIFAFDKLRAQISSELLESGKQPQVQLLSIVPLNRSPKDQSSS